MKRVMVTGGAGFIGSHLCDALVEAGCEVLLFDCLLPQVHGPDKEWPDYLNWRDEPEGITFWFGDVRDPLAVMGALTEFQPDTVIHLAAAVGVGQSNVQIAHYTSCNVTGTAILLDMLLRYNDTVDDRAAKLAEMEAVEQPDRKPKPGEYYLEPRGLGADDDIEEGDEMRVWMNDAWGDWILVDDESIGTSLDGGVGPDFDYRRPSDKVKRAVYETQEEANERHEEETNAVRDLPDTKVDRVFVAGSMSSYGEGLYEVGMSDAETGKKIATASMRGLGRTSRSIRFGWDPPAHPDGGEGGLLNTPIGITEDGELRPASVYAWTKSEQERLALMVGRFRGLDVRVGRFFNVYGTRQSLSNPYTGVAAIFASRLLAGKPPLVYEDGIQSRDFIHVDDLVSGIITIINKGEAGGVYNVGTGQATSIFWLATEIAIDLLGPAPVVTGQCRVGDVRHCFADATKLRALGWAPETVLVDGLREYIEWLKTQDADGSFGTDNAHDELTQHGLLIEPETTQQ